MIILNSAQCLNCNDILVSKHRHDFRQCSCGNVFVDGGTDYIRHGVVNESLYEDLSEVK